MHAPRSDEHHPFVHGRRDRSLGRVRDHSGDASRETESGQRRPGFRCDTEQLASAFVDHPRDSIGVDRDHPFGSGVQHRVLFADQLGHLLGFESEGEPAPASGEQPGTDDPDHEGQCCQPDQQQECPASGVGDGAHRHADADQADHGSVRAVDRRLGTHRIAQGASLFRDFDPTCESDRRVSTQWLAQLGRVRVGDPVARVVGDHHEQHTGPVGDRLSLVLERPRAEFRRRRGVPLPAGRGLHRGARSDIGVGGDGFGDRLGTMPVLGAGLRLHPMQHDTEARAQARDDDHHLEEEDLRAQPEPGHPSSLVIGQALRKGSGRARRPPPASGSTPRRHATAPSCGGRRARRPPTRPAAGSQEPAGSACGRADP
ncbi:hypothetical protein TPAU25S_02878 [Tsukamurella paurometabola]